LRLEIVHKIMIQERGIGVLNLGVEIIRKLMVQERVTLEEYTRGV